MYKTWIRPWVKLLATRSAGDALGNLNPSRMQRLSFRHFSVGTIHSRTGQAGARQPHHRIPDDHPLRQLEKKIAGQIASDLDQFRDQRDAQSVTLTRQLYGPNGLGAWFKPDQPDAEVAHERPSANFKARGPRFWNTLREVVLPKPSAALCWRVWCPFVVERRSLRLAKLLAQLPVPGSKRRQFANKLDYSAQRARAYHSGSAG